MVTKILVADDEAVVAETIASILEVRGYAVLRAHDGAAALTLLRRGGLDLLIADQLLPWLSGLELAAYTRERPGAAREVILMSTAWPATRPPGVAFLPKPFDIEDLLALVDRLLASAPRVRDGVAGERGV